MRLIPTPLAVRPLRLGSLVWLVAIGAHAPTARAQPASWIELGPAPITSFAGAVGRVSAIVTHPTDASIYYVAGADGGVWRTRDAGLSWTPLTDSLPTTAIGALAMSPTDPGVIYAGSGEANFANHSRYGAGLYKTEDGGDTWRVLAASTFAGRCFSTIALSPSRPGTLFAAVTRAGGFPELAAAKGHPLALAPVGLFRSDDAGETWTLVPGLPAIDSTDVSIDPSNPSVMYAALGRVFGSPDNGIYRSTDGGLTWTKLTLPIGSLGRLGVLATPGRVLAHLTRAAAPDGSGGNTLGIIRSTTAGATWESIVPLDSPSYGWYFARLAANPANPLSVYTGTLSLYRSSNGGAQFSNIGPPHPDVHAIAWDAAGRLLVGSDGGLYRSASGAGGDWVALNSRLGLIQMYAGLSTHPTDDRAFLAGMQDNGSAIRTPDLTGLTWRSVTGGDGGWTQISPHNPRIMLTEYQGTGMLFRSTNAGASFSGVGGGLTGRNCFLPPFLFDPQIPGRVIYATERLWVSTNDGSFFTPLSADLTAGGTAAIRSFEIARSDPTHLYAATNDGRVLASTDGGISFTLCLSGNPGWPRVTRELRAHPFEPATVYLAGAAFGVPHVRRSTDAGITWSTLDGDIPDAPINVIGVDHRGRVPVLYAAGDSGVWRSANDGATWHPVGTGLPSVAVIDLHVEPTRGGAGRLVIATQGRGAWVVSLPCTGDFDGDGFIDIFDYLAYVEVFESGGIGADANGDGFLDAFDYERFVADFEAGCT